MNKGITVLSRVGSGEGSTSALLCVPHAGAGAATFARWARDLTGTACVLAASFPGREIRVAESPLRTISAMADSLVESAREIDASTLTVYGHCSGALVAYELTHRLVAHNDQWDQLQLVVSGQAGPLNYSQPSIWSPESMTVTEVAAYLRELGGTADKALANREFMELMAPAIRADLSAVADYADAQGRMRLTIPVHALAGQDDNRTPIEQLESWRSCTTGPFTMHVLAGGHFFPGESHDQVIEFLRDLL